MSEKNNSRNSKMIDADALIESRRNELRSSSLRLYRYIVIGEIRDAVQYLGLNHIDVNFTDKDDGSTLLHVAVQEGDPRLVRMLLDRGASANAQNNNGKTPLHIATYRGNCENIELLLRKGADVNVRDKEGKTALDCASEVKRGDIADIFELNRPSSRASNLQPSSRLSGASLGDEGLGKTGKGPKR